MFTMEPCREYVIGSPFSRPACFSRVDSAALAVSTSRGKLVVLGIDDAGTATVQMQLQAHTAVRGGEDSLKHYAEIWSIAWAPDDTRICTVSEDRVARVWTAAGAFVTELTGHSMAVTCVDWQRTQVGEMLATCSDDRTVRLWDPASWRLIHTLVSDVRPVISCA